MNEWIDRLFELDRRNRYLAYAGAFAVVILLYWFFLHSGLSAQIAEKRSQVEQLDQDHARKLQQASRLDEYKEKVRELDARLQRAVAQLPDQKEIPDLLSSVSTLGRDSGLEILLFRQRPEVLHEFYAEVPVEMMMRGTYRQVVTFLDRVGNLDRIVNVTNLAMKNPVVTEAELVIDTSCTAVTFRFLSEEERERIAAEKAREKKRR